MRIRSRVCEAFEAIAKSAYVSDIQATDSLCKVINSRELQALRAIDEGVETPTALAARLSTSATYVTTILDTLEEHKLAVRMVVRGEKSKALRLTKAGRATIERFANVDEVCKQRLVEEYGLDPQVIDAIVEKFTSKRRR